MKYQDQHIDYFQEHLAFLQLVEFEYEEYFKIGIKVNITSEEEQNNYLENMKLRELQ